MDDAVRAAYSSTTVGCAANMDLARETGEACCIIFKHTPWHVRLLTKSSFLPQLVKWIPEEWHQRLILGVSIGTLDDNLAKAIEVGTPLVSKRLASLHALQDQGFRTFGMMCPSLPQVDYVKFAQDMAQAIRMEKCEYVWAEVINVRGQSLTNTVTALEAASFQEDANQPNPSLSVWTIKGDLIIGFGRDAKRLSGRRAFLAIRRLPPLLFLCNH